MKILYKTIILVVIFSSCHRIPELHHAEKDGFLMDTLVHVSLFDDMPQASLNALCKEVFSVMQGIEKNVSAYMDGSDPDLLVKNAGKGFCKINPETEMIIRESLEISRTTDGAFDITIGALKTLYGLDSGKFRVPDSSELRSYLELGNYRNIELSKGEARINRSGLGLDMGGIAKGYIIDTAVRWLEEKDVNAGLVEAGGDLRIFGAHPKRKEWRIGIQHPRSERGDLIGVIAVNNMGIVTSGDYERYFIQDGVRYHHLLDPKTGLPARHAVSVTIIAPTAMVADAYATAIFILGPKTGIDLLNTIPGIEGLLISEDDNGLNYYLSKDAAQWIQLNSG